MHYWDIKYTYFQKHAEDVLCTHRCVHHVMLCIYSLATGKDFPNHLLESTCIIQGDICKTVQLDTFLGNPTIEFLAQTSHSRSCCAFPE